MICEVVVRGQAAHNNLTNISDHFFYYLLIEGLSMRTENSSGTTVLTPDMDVRPRKNWRSWLIGPALPTADAPHQTIGKAVGLAVFASDALSSTAYATQE